MPDPKDFKTKSEFVSACIAQRQTEHADEAVSQSAAICYSMWGERSEHRQVEPEFDESYGDFMDRCTTEEGLDIETCQTLWEDLHAIDRVAKNNIERRASKLEIRARGRRLEGYAAVFNVEARIGDFIETIAPGAFRSVSRDTDILALVDHDPTRVLARTRSKTLRLGEDSKGLHFDLKVPDTTHGRDVLALAERSDLGGMSFGFIATQDEWSGDRRTLRAVDLKEISVVSAWPAYEGTVVQARDRFYSNRIKLALARRYLETL
jgi:HK97 family phage prohead protease